MMKDRYLLLNNLITIGIFISNISSDISESEQDEISNQNRSIIVLISKNGKYLRIYDNLILATRKFSVTSKDCYQNHYTEYCPSEYLEYVRSTAAFRNTHVSNYQRIYWSKRLFPELMIDMSDKYLQLFPPSQGKQIGSPLNEFNSISWILAGEKLFDSDCYQILAHDLHFPDRNYIAICPFYQRVKLIYTIAVKENDHHLFDYYQKLSFQVESRKEVDSVPGYLHCTLASYVPLYDLHQNNLLYELVLELYRHYSLEENDHVLITQRRMVQKSDSSSTYGAEMKDLIELSPYLTSLILNSSEEDEPQSSEAMMISKQRYPVFNTLPFFITHERCDGYDFHYNQPHLSPNIKDDGSSAIQSELIEWLLMLAIPQNLNKRVIARENVFSVVDNEIWAMPSLLQNTPKDPSSILIILRNEICYLLQTHLSPKFHTTQLSIHSNFISHLYLLTNEENYLESKSPNGIDSRVIENFDSLSKYRHVFQKCLTYFNYVDTNLSALQYFYQQYLDRNPQLQLQVDNSTNEEEVSNLILGELKKRAETIDCHTTLTEEHLTRTCKYTLFYMNNIDHLGNHNTNEVHDDDIAKHILQIHANYFKELLIIKFDLVKKCFTLLLADGKEVIFTLQQFQRNEGIFDQTSMVSPSVFPNTSNSVDNGTIVNDVTAFFIELKKKINELLSFAQWTGLSKNQRKLQLERQEAIAREVERARYETQLYLKMQRILQDSNDPLWKYYSKIEIDDGFDEEKKQFRELPELSMVAGLEESFGDDEEKGDEIDDNVDDSDADDENDSRISYFYDKVIQQREDEHYRRKWDADHPFDNDEEDDEIEEILNTTFVASYSPPDLSEVFEDENFPISSLPPLTVEKSNKHKKNYLTKMQSKPSVDSYLSVYEEQLKNESTTNWQIFLDQKLKEFDLESRRIQRENKDFVELMSQLYDDS